MPHGVYFMNDINQHKLTLIKTCADNRTRHFSKLIMLVPYNKTLLKTISCYNTDNNYSADHIMYRKNTVP